MLNADAWSLHHLFQFLEGSVTHILNAKTRAAKNITVELHAVGLVVEATLWIELGGLVGYFPRKEAFEAILNLTSSLLLSEEERTRIANQFLGASRQLVREISQRQNPFDHEDGASQIGMETLGPAFQACLMQTAAFWRDAPSMRLSAALTFDNSLTWESRIREMDSQGVNAETIARGLISGESSIDSVTPSDLCGGCVRALDHMVGYQSLFLNNLFTRSTDSSIEDAYFLFQRRVGEIQSWGFDFRDSAKKRWFRECAKQVAAQMFPAEPGALNRQSYLKQVDAVMNDWAGRATGGLMAGAGA